MEAASERLLSLRPVTFRYKQAFEGGDKPVQFGLIAEEVADVFPELVVYNEEGTPEAVIQINGKQQIRAAGFGRGCVKRQIQKSWW